MMPADAALSCVPDRQYHNRIHCRRFQSDRTGSTQGVLSSRSLSSAEGEIDSGTVSSGAHQFRGFLAGRDTHGFGIDVRFSLWVGWAMDEYGSFDMLCFRTLLTFFPPRPVLRPRSVPRSDSHLDQYGGLSH